MPGFRDRFQVVVDAANLGLGEVIPRSVQYSVDLRQDCPEHRDSCVCADEFGSNYRQGSKQPGGTVTGERTAEDGDDKGKTSQRPDGGPFPEPCVLRSSESPVTLLVWRYQPTAARATLGTA